MDSKHNQKKTERSENRLRDAKNPYLIQHSDNPVDWYSWCPEAFLEAKRQNKPIFLSIGYSTCHWCHVMERESFQDMEVAKEINRVFIAVKVDREERPDIDAIYMNVCQMLTGSGGWPLTIIMSPDKKPFWAGTYLPKTAQYGRPGLLDLISKIDRIWSLHQTQIHQAAEQIIDVVNTSSDDGVSTKAAMPAWRDVEKAYRSLEEQYDNINGGFGSFPKFAMPVYLLFCFRYWYHTGNTSALDMAVASLESIRLGALHDHIGNGFHRYSTDACWRTPHYEKMLYDQALLGYVYTEAFQATQNIVFRKTAEKTMDYVLTDLADSSGAFYTAEDADTEGFEGLYYLWKRSELERILTKDEFAVFRTAFSVPDFSETHDGHNEKIPLVMTTDNLNSTDKLGMSIDVYRSSIENSLKKLAVERAKRTRPFRDEKILTDWNGLMIAALAKAGAVFQRHDYINAAERAVRFITTELFIDKTTICHSFYKGNTGIKGFLDDYAFLVLGLIELFQATFHVEYLERSVELGLFMIDQFKASDGNGFSFTQRGVESPFVPPKNIFDSVIPSGNSVIIYNLIRLHHLTGKAIFRETAEKYLYEMSGSIQEHPSAFTMLLISLMFEIATPCEIIITGQPEKNTTEKVLEYLHEAYLPDTVILYAHSESNWENLKRIAPFIEMYPSGEHLRMYLCSNHACREPVENLDMLKTLLKHRRSNSNASEY
ncbi:thioredoxin domain-containing protein [bacterium]|nr:thioredoxin domain-containing protein [candidate division CSSED10-310 bacterium]